MMTEYGLIIDAIMVNVNIYEIVTREILLNIL